MFVDAIGVIVSKDAWLAQTKQVVGCEIFTLNNDDVEVFTRFTGLDHGNYKAWELGVTGNPKNAKHVGLHGRHELFASLAEADAAHTKAVADVVKVGGTVTVEAKKNEVTVIVGP